MIAIDATSCELGKLEDELTEGGGGQVKLTSFGLPVLSSFKLDSWPLKLHSSTRSQAWIS